MDDAVSVPTTLPLPPGGGPSWLPPLLDAGYAAALAAAAPALAWRAWRRRKGIAEWRSRLAGAAPCLGRPAVWMHAVSVGEVLLAGPILRRLAAERPDVRLALSASTASGLAVARQRGDAAVFPAPIDFSWPVGRCFRRLQPSVLVLAELELWPNLLLAARRRGVPVLVANARLGERSARGYLRAARWLRPALAAVRWWGAQSPEVAERIRALLQRAGLPDTVELTGSVKFDGAAIDRGPATDSLRRLLGYRPGDLVFVAGSTQAPEEELVLDAFAALRGEFPSLRLLLAPRHPERADEVAALAERRGLPLVRRSRLADGSAGMASPPVALLDTVGELAAAWGLAAAAFVGGSLDGRRGGQNMLEPAALGVPTCFGPHTWNFVDAVAKLLACNGAVEIADGALLQPTLASWLRRPQAAGELGARARAFVLAQRGALDKTLAALRRWLPPAETPAETPAVAAAMRAAG